jgi:HSP20 family molecular chaperone IbpA
MKKPSFLERLTGSVNLDQVEDDGFEEEAAYEEARHDEEEDERSRWNKEIEEEADGELPIDMYETGDAIVIRALVAGVNPGDLDIAITRDMVTLKGRREEMQEAPDENYLHRELFWGTFSRTIMLPDEVLIDEAEARERHGLLEIILPKVDKERSTKLKVTVK